MLKVVYFGTPDFALCGLKALEELGIKPVFAVTQSDKPQGRQKILTPSPVKRYCLDNQVAVYQPERVKDPQFIAKFVQNDVDLILTCAYGQIIPRKIIEHARYGAYNLHASLLPRWRGASPVQTALAHGDRKTGVTLMKMDEGLDSGDIVSAMSVEINIDDTLSSLYKKLWDIAVKLTVQVLPCIVRGEVKLTPQDPELSSYAPLLTREDGKIIWERHDACSLYNFIRGFNPWPGTFALTSDGRKLKLLMAKCIEKAEVPQLQDQYNTLALTETSEASNNMAVLFACNKRLFLCLHGGFLEILQLQMAGKKALYAHECEHNFRSGLYLY